MMRKYEGYDSKFELASSMFKGLTPPCAYHAFGYEIEAAESARNVDWEHEKEDDPGLPEGGWVIKQTAARKALGDAWVDTFMHYLTTHEKIPNCGVAVRMTRASSPREYNFASDAVEMDINIPYETLEWLLDNAENDIEAFDKWLGEHYSSYDGFISFMPSSWDDFASYARMRAGEKGDIERNRRLAQLIQYALFRTDEDIGRFNDDLQDEVEGRLSDSGVFAVEDWAFDPEGRKDEEKDRMEYSAGAGVWLPFDDYKAFLTVLRDECKKKHAWFNRVEWM